MVSWAVIRAWGESALKHGKDIAALTRLAAETKDTLKKLDERTEKMKGELDYLRGHVDAIVKSAVDKAVSEAKYEAQKVASDAVRDMYRDMMNGGPQRWPSNAAGTINITPQIAPEPQQIPPPESSGLTDS